MDQVRCWKIVEVKDHGLLTLFHAYPHFQGRSRKLISFLWLSAERKMVDDGWKKKKYQSGWHVFREYDTAMNYLLKRFKRKEGRELQVAECMALGLKRKPRSRNIWLADEIYMMGV